MIKDTKADNGGVAVSGKARDIYQGISAEDYRIGLQEERKDTTRALEGKFGEERKRLKAKLAELNNKLANREKHSSYATHLHKSSNSKPIKPKHVLAFAPILCECQKPDY